MNEHSWHAILMILLFGFVALFIIVMLWMEWRKLVRKTKILEVTMRMHGIKRKVSFETGGIVPPIPVSSPGKRVKK